MKICVCSDSHGNYYGLQELIDREKPRYVYFLGDGERDWGQVDLSWDTAFAAVSGNCDFLSMEPPFRKFELGGKKIFMTHGHMYGAKQGLHGLVQQATQCNADLVLYGHTHQQKLEQIGNTLYLCPGSMNSSENRYAIVTIDENHGIDIALCQL